MPVMLHADIPLLLAGVGGAIGPLAPSVVAAPGGAMVLLLFITFEASVVVDETTGATVVVGVIISESRANNRHTATEVNVEVDP